MLGLSTSNILNKLSAEFIQVVFISFILASGIAYYVMSKWLEDFQYSIKLAAGIFIAAGIDYYRDGNDPFLALKAAFRNPVDSLRNE